MIFATAVMCTGRQGYLGYYAYWTRNNLRKTIDSTKSAAIVGAALQEEKTSPLLQLYKAIVASRKLKRNQNLFLKDSII